ncbi:DEAD/DEAH box helicase [Apiospora aurea]|uniref:ATP-dependent RNA helicase n=1 Tax=Apiospora aurea TaxID=335848 RepID=A0ABR1Q6C1_9PEZI
MYARYIPSTKPAPAAAPVPETKPIPATASPRPAGTIATMAMAPTVGAYGRYIPPPKLEEAAKLNKKIIFGDDDSIPQHKILEDNCTLATSSSITTTAYGRWIPPPKMEEAAVADDEPPSKRVKVDKKKDRKKKKKSKKESEESPAPKDHPTTAVEDTGFGATASPVKEKSPELAESPSKEKNSEMAESPAQAKKPKRVKKKKSKAKPETNTGVDEPVNTRHKGVFEKKAKSMKAPDPENAVDPQDDDQDVPMVDAPEPEVHGLQPLPQPEPRAPEPPMAPQTELPSWLYEHIKVSRDATAPFTSLGLKPESGITAEDSKRLEAKGYKEAHGVQTVVIPQLLPHHCITMHSDLLVSAETGSGKTLAYALPIIRNLSRSAPACTLLRAIVVVPSRNLAQQVHKVCEEFADIFYQEGKRRIKVGIATGQRPLEEEKSALVERRERYDPVGYKERLERVKTQSRRARYEDNSEDEERNEIFRQEDRIKTLRNHVIEYVSKVEILICTTGRLLEHMKLTPGFNLEDVCWLVLDEADKFFGHNHQQFLDVVIPAVHENKRFRRYHLESRLTGVRKVILSASMTTDLDKLGPLKLRMPRLVELVSEDGQEASGRETMLNLPATLREYAIKVDLELKPLFLLDLLESDRIMSSDADDSSDSDSASDAKPPLPPKILIFTRTRENAIRLARLLVIMAPKLEPLIECLTSDSTSKTQVRTLNKFRAGKLRIVISSDLLARGIDLPDIKHVINYDMPNSVTSYVHRVGRTARAHRSGHAWTLFTYQEARWFWSDVAGKDAEVRRSKEVERVRITEEKDEATFGARKARFEAAVAQLAEE